MSVVTSGSSVVVSTTQSIALGSLFQVVGSSGNPAYLVLNAFDRNEYPATASGATGSFTSSVGTRGLTTSNQDARETGIVFQYQSATGRYLSTTMGYLDQLGYTPSTSAGDITDLSLFGTSSARLANSFANDALTLAYLDPGGFLGTVTVATEAGFVGPVSAQATPGSIASIAQSFAGQAWNRDGCWTLTSTIAAEAGASLPLQSTADLPGQANGEWFVAYNGPTGSSGDWQSMVQTGDMIGFTTGAGGGHITTCVSGAGGSARLIDNVTYVDSDGNVLNGANDGSADDVTIDAPHLATQEWSGVQASSVVIYRLDTPIVVASKASLSLAAGASVDLSTVFSASDAAGKSVTKFQVYAANANDTVFVGGLATAAYSAVSAVTIAALTQISLVAGLGGLSDVVTVRASNGSYWGDWVSLTVSTAATVPSVSAAVAPSAAVTTVATGPAIVRDTVAVYRFFEQTDGTHFFTASSTERDALLATRTDLVFEGVGLDGLGSSGSSSQAVFRFFDQTHGTHFYTASTSERDSLATSRPDMTLEGVAFYEDVDAQAGDSAVYRFFDTQHGTHLFTGSATERASILATRPDLVAEGIAFYAPTT